MEPGNERRVAQKVPEDDEIKGVELLFFMKAKPVSDADAIFIESVRQQGGSPISDEQLETGSCQDTISWRGSPTPEDLPMSPPNKLGSPWDSRDTKPAHEATPQPVEHGPAKRQRGAKGTGRIPAASAVKAARHKKKSDTRKRRAATPGPPMTAEQKRAAKEARDAADRMHLQRSFKKRDRGEVGLALNAIGAPLPGAGIPAELSINERKSRSSKLILKQE
ncbi:hypothetical protein BcDW1_3350 [Botrytis cinerea BcDW1]|uniref:Uncharacterized protein n=1 Tax=Botryotinia fuckeliana (strain BcDW1) TaxID=1290391 RepID=M7UVW2_BOTF1|nr:hypothetical protein BcDW1_3350 [Botrytis cinerea BcDW1]